MAEVGVYFPETSNVLDFIEAGVRTTLVEPDPECIRRIRDRFGDLPHVTLHPVAIHETVGTLRLVQRDASTYVAGVAASPAQVNDGYREQEADVFEVEAMPFDAIDDGTIDLLSVDIEGSEWQVIRNLVSRPAVVSVETHGAAYVNPDLAHILAWAHAAGYRIWYKDRTDTVFVRPESIRITLVDRARLAFMEIYLRFRRLRKRARLRLARPS